MGTKLTFLRAASLGLQIVGGFGFVEVRWLEARIMFGGHPVDPFFIEAASIFLVVFGTVSLVGFCWNWISTWGWVAPHLITARDKAKAEQNSFHALASQIRHMRDDFVKVLQNFESGERKIERYEVNAEMADIGIKLKRIGVDVPESVEGENIRDVVDRWRIYLSVLLPLSETADLERARTISVSEKSVEIEI